VKSLLSSGWLDGLAIGAAALLSVGAIAVFAFAPSDPKAGLGVVFAPWVSERAAFTRSVEAGARFVRFGGFPFIVVVMPEAPDYAARVSAAGAWFIVDPQALAACLPFTAPPTATAPQT
jgi:hypothetical protein